MIRIHTITSKGFVRSKAITITLATNFLDHPQRTRPTTSSWGQLSLQQQLAYRLLLRGRYRYYFSSKYLDRFKQFETKLLNRYEMRTLGELTWFLGIQVVHDRSARKL